MKKKINREYVFINLPQNNKIALGSDYSFGTVRNQTTKEQYRQQLIKRRSKVHQNIMPRECTLNLEQ